MKKPDLGYDFSYMLSESVGRGGIPESDLPAIFRDAADARSAFLKHVKSGEIGFPSSFGDKKALEATLALAKKIRAACSTLVVIGIGGSDLGARTLLRALGKGKGGMDVRFIGANTDPDEIARFEKDIPWKKTALCLVSKSGETIEPLSTFLYLRKKLEAAVGKKNIARHIVAITDPEHGSLRQLAIKEKYYALDMPPTIGGRFSVFTAVGAFPAACAGIDVAALLSGAQQTYNEFATYAPERNAALQFAALQHAAYVRRGRGITVLMPYADALRDLALWFRQLWAESLGKKLDRSGHEVSVGLTPIAALGATDQHSQIQLYNEGPHDKTITFIEVETFAANVRVPVARVDDGIGDLGGKPFSEIIHAERRATAESLAANGRPNGTISIGAITPENIGALLAFFMAATAIVGELLDINAYDQPGVEEGKRIMRRLLAERPRLKN